MTVFRYLIAKYKVQDSPAKPSVNIGVIVQSDNEIDCKFTQDFNRAKAIDEIHPDKGIFISLENTFKQNFKNETFVISDKNTGGDRVIKYTDQAYLDFLSSTFLNNYVFNNRGNIEAKDMKDALTRLYEEFVDPTYTDGNRKAKPIV